MDTNERDELLAKAGYQLNAQDRMYKNGSSYPFEVKLAVITALRQLEEEDPTKSPSMRSVAR